MDAARFQSQHDSLIQAAELALRTLTPAAETRPARLHAAMRYSLEAGGKRLRPVLCLAAVEREVDRSGDRRIADAHLTDAEQIRATSDCLHAEGHGGCTVALGERRLTGDVAGRVVERQIEGAIVYGLTAALYGKITLKDGRVEQGNFHDYPVLRHNEMPKVEVHIVKSTEKPGGIGEPGTPPVAPAVANAIFAATGKRLRSLPFDTSQLKKA